MGDRHQSKPARHTPKNTKTVKSFLFYTGASTYIDELATLRPSVSFARDRGPDTPDIESKCRGDDTASE